MVLTIEDESIKWPGGSRLYQRNFTKQWIFAAGDSLIPIRFKLSKYLRVKIFQHQTVWRHDPDPPHRADHRGATLHLHQEQDIRRVVWGGGGEAGVGGVSRVHVHQLRSGVSSSGRQLLLPRILHGPAPPAQHHQQLHLQSLRESWWWLRDTDSEQWDRETSLDWSDRRAGGGESWPHPGSSHHQPWESSGDGVQQTFQVPGHHHPSEAGMKWSHWGLFTFTISVLQCFLWKLFQLIFAATASESVSVIPAAIQVHFMDISPGLCQGHRCVFVSPRQILSLRSLQHWSQWSQGGRISEFDECNLVCLGSALEFRFKQIYFKKFAFHYISCCQVLERGLLAASQLVCLEWSGPGSPWSSSLPTLPTSLLSSFLISLRQVSRELTTQG